MLAGTGGFYRRSDSEALHAMFKRHRDEMEAAIQADTTGDGFIFEMFDYELANHEYGYTGELEETLDALGLDEIKVQSHPNLLHGLERACKEQSNCF